MSMKRMFTGLLLAIFMCGAGTNRLRVPVPEEVNCDALRERLRESGYNVAAVVSGPPSYIQWGPGGETKDPTPIIESLLDAETLRMRILARKWNAGAITAEEKDELLRLFILRHLRL